MARVYLDNSRSGYGDGSSSSRPDNNPTIGIGNRDGFGSMQTEPDSQISQDVINSSTYQEAFAIFSEEPNKLWLSRLIIIPYSVIDAPDTWFDDVGLSNRFEDKQYAAYQYCMEQITALVAEYQQWKNSLPTTQANQQSQIGLNSAITGEAIGNSDISNIPVNSNPSQVASTEPIDILSRVGSAFMDINTGVLSWFKAFNSLGIAREQLGISRDQLDLTRMLGVGQLNLGAETLGLSREQLGFAKQTLTANLENAKTDQEIALYRTFLDYLDRGYKNLPAVPEPLEDRVTDLEVSALIGDPASVGKQAVASTYSTTAQLENATMPNITSSILSEMKKYNTTQLDIIKLRIERNKAQVAYEKALSDFTRGTLNADGGTPFENGKYVAKLRREIDKYDSRINQMRYDYINNLAQNQDNPTCNYLLNYMLSGYNMIDVINSNRNYELGVDYYNLGVYNAETQRSVGTANALMPNIGIGLGL